ncbi:DNA internalization-related competence protein ComEC/Rec2 [Rosenbergiella australiborealis]|uniref:DNA internalization-related competence protein ComEC/Rec2 n=1 Tax=Rosenbergiella australiborealis TaxID=1544696 RepID=A0ABS5T3N1_9GAMM|nr:DNA internalization-related competence protein ComEC/Rec2 [Rosenbergiella australiborealis]MBT0726954.1 DNA internalization-related competence protein ComEC/Rec2 [Rosenbergiella australiborealis]
MQLLPYARLVIFACLPLLFLSTLIDVAILLIGIPVAIYLIRVKQTFFHYLGVVILLCAVNQLIAHAALTTMTLWSERPIVAVVTVSEVQPLMGRMKLALQQVNGQLQFPVYEAWIYQEEIHAYCPGQRWLMELALRPVHSLLNEGGYDRQRNALAKDTLFSGKILSKTPITTQCSFRYQLEQLFQKNSASSPWQGLSRALVFGLRDGISPSVNQLFRETGTGHLMAISGMHIGLVFLLVSRTISLVQPLLPIALARPLVAEIGGWIASGFYCYLSGGQPSAMRAIFALTCWLIAKRHAINFSGFQVLLLCIAGLLLINPLMILSDSLWLSALAVLALLLWYRWFPLPPKYQQRKRYALIRLLHLQIGIMLLLLPVQVFFFNGTSLTALGANLVAIPIISLGALPLSLLLMLPWPILLSRGLLGIHDAMYQLLFDALTLQRGGWYALTTAPLFVCGVWGGLLFIRFYWWRQFPLSLGTILLTVISWRTQPSDIVWRVDMLDVGHGLAVIISQGKEGVIYDTGNRWQEGDAGERIITPWLQSQQIVPITAIISHRHSDHIGGLESLQKVWPNLSVKTAFPYPGALPCQRGEQWQWKALTFRVLLPEKMETAGKNNDSCVLYISDGKHHLLLTGDIEKKAEQRLVELEKSGLPVSWLQVPHHGSRTSSTSLFLRKFNADVALASVARYNAWRLPATPIVKRYYDHGIFWMDTAQAGQISIRVRTHQVELLQLRDQISPRWYHQWFGVKPDYG